MRGPGPFTDLPALSSRDSWEQSPLATRSPQRELNLSHEIPG